MARQHESSSLEAETACSKGVWELFRGAGIALSPAVPVDACQIYSISTLLPRDAARLRRRLMQVGELGFEMVSCDFESQIMCL